MTIPAIDPAAKSVNVRRSLEAYFYNNLYTAEGFAVDWEGVKFNETDVSEWLQPRILSMAWPKQLRQGSSSQYAEQVNIFFQVNIFVKKGQMAYSDRHYQIRDKVVKYFRSGTGIGIEDYESGGTTVLNYLTVRRLTTDRILPEQQELHQYVVAFEIDFTRLVANP